MSKVYMIFLFLLSGIVQLSHTKPFRPLGLYGTVFLFKDGIKEENLVEAKELSKNSPQITLSTEKRVSCSNDTQKEIFTIEVSNEGKNEGEFYFTHYTLLFRNNDPFDIEVDVESIGWCPTNQAAIRWQRHIKSKQTTEEQHTYDLIFIRSTTKTITAENLNEISPEPEVNSDNFIEKLYQK